MLTACLAWNTQAHAQESYTSADLLERPIEAQNAHIQVSVMMIGVVATQIRPDIAHCVNDWYGGEQMGQRNEFIRSMMLEHSEFHPAGVILAIVQRECGRFADES